MGDNKELIKQCEERAQQWLTPAFDEETRKEVQAMLDAEDKSALIDAFYQNLEFGTGGLRGIMGAGTNRMNYYTVRKATTGLANYINSMNVSKPSVVIAFDSRRMSPEFADEAALCLAANNIKAYVFESLRPTPELSFAVRYLDCVAGINVTASHNPPEYNGYKVYWEDGAQITPPHDQGIMAEVKAITDFADTKTMDMVEAKKKGLLVTIGSEVDDAYMGELKKLILNQDAIDKYGKDLKIVYTPLHGTGNIPVRRILKEIGFENVYVVPEQELPDGEFPTVEYPNPEAKEAFTLALKLAKEVDADLVLATDPDADRLGCYAKDSKTGEYKVFTGNMSGSLLCEYEVSQMKEKNGSLPADGAIVKTIVTTNMVDAIAKYYGTDLIECFTGFKNIGREILRFEQTGKGTYLFGFEESYGCLIGTHARDKDAVVATMALCEAAAYYRGQGKTLWDAMMDMYEKYGYYVDDIKTVTLKGVEGSKKIGHIMNILRANVPEQVAGYKTKVVRDYRLEYIRNIETGEVKPTGFPNANVLYYELENDAWLAVRPSGTEPKIKFYYGIKGSSYDEAQKESAAFGDKVMDLIYDILEK